MKLVTITSICCLFAGAIFARDLGNGPGSLVNEHNKELKVHRQSNMWLSVTNYGVLGSQGREIIDPETGLAAPSLELPAGSAKEYLFQGSIWIGGILERPYNPGVYDTLVSIGNDGWWGEIFELMPPDSGSRSLWSVQGIGDQDIYGVCYDTNTTDPNPDPNDSRPHRPLGLKVTQHSFGWISDGFDELFIINYYLQNITYRQLGDIWVGFYVDGDVFDTTESPYSGEEGAQDDLCGSVIHNGYHIAWIADNNGQPYDGQFDYRSPTGVTGMILLGGSQPGLQTNFNWWISNVNSQFDWGPMKQVNYNRLQQLFGQANFPGGGLGTPGGDRAKYVVMSNGEQDYDQAQSALNHTNSGWIPNSLYDPANLANGYDTRYLYSIGPMQLNAGETETLTVALIGGNNFHVDPNNYAARLQFHTSDSAYIAQYYSNLNFTNFFAKAETAISLYQQHFYNAPFEPPLHFRPTTWDPNQVRLVWSPKVNPLLREYQIYRGTSPGIYDSIPITPANFLDTVFTDTNVIDNTWYYYVIACGKTIGGRSRFSPEIYLNTGQPSAPTQFRARGNGSHEITLNWQPNPENDIRSYAIYRKTLEDTSFAVIDSSLDTNFTDGNLINCQKYTYRITAIDIMGTESFLSDSSSGIPLPLDSGVLLLNNNLSNPDYNSMLTFYNNALSGRQFTISNYRIDSLSQLAAYSTIIWCKELTAGRNTFARDDPHHLFADYLDNGGSLILTGTRNIVAIGFSGEQYFSPNDFLYKYFNIEGVRFPNYRDTQFVGGQAVASGFFDFNIDTSRANRIVFPDTMHNGRLYGIGAIIPHDSNEVIYRYVAANPETDTLQGNPIAIIHNVPYCKTAVLEFPLYFIEEPVSFAIIDSILGAFERAAIDNAGSQIPLSYNLLQNYPNPFNFTTTMIYELPQAVKVRLSVYNILGQKVVTLIDQFQQAGRYQVPWNASGFPSGIYLARLETGTKIIGSKLVLLK